MKEKNSSKIRKHKIFNDPVLGFISVSDNLILELIEHSYFQRLRRISQTGLTQYVYPGATHTRFLHALGCLHLMQSTLQVLKSKGVNISEEEERAAQIAILLHDIGHGPFSHALESTIMEGIHHEDLSITFMNLLNEEFSGELTLAIQIFLNKYKRKFFYQLISSQIDLDRLDYLKRDSFFTGVSEGNINSERIITMMNVVDDELVIDDKGIYSIEKYLTARMFMYWQVYFHKTSVTSEVLLTKIFKRAKKLVKDNVELPAPDALSYFLHKTEFNKLENSDLEEFAKLDDSDMLYAVKSWQNHQDKILSTLSMFISQRKLPKSSITSIPLSDNELQDLIKQTKNEYGVSDGKYFVEQTILKFRAYNDKKSPIKLLLKNKKVKELQDMESQVLVKDLKNEIIRYHVCIPRY